MLLSLDTFLEMDGSFSLAVVQRWMPSPSARVSDGLPFVCRSALRSRISIVDNTTLYKHTYSKLDTQAHCHILYTPIDTGGLSLWPLLFHRELARRSSITCTVTSPLRHAPSCRARHLPIESITQLSSHYLSASPTAPHNPAPTITPAAPPKKTASPP